MQADAFVALVISSRKNVYGYVRSVVGGQQNLIDRNGKPFPMKMKFVKCMCEAKGVFLTQQKNLKVPTNLEKVVCVAERQVVLSL